MAGISLGLRRVLGSRSFVEQATGYLYAGLAMAGPWLMAAAALAILQAGPVRLLPGDEQKSFYGLLLYAYAGSTVLMGTLQLGIARHASDLLYRRDVSGIAPAYSAGALIALLLHAGAAGALAWERRFDPLLAWAWGVFGASLGLVWTGMIFLGAIRRFMAIVAVFGAGMSVAAALGIVLAPRYGAAGLLASLAAGHLGIAAFIAARLRAEFPSARVLDFGFFSTLRRHPSLAGIGVIGAAALWCDRGVYWTGPWSEPFFRGLRFCPLYDNAVFLATLTTIPSLALLFIRIEGSFFERGRAFYRAIHEGADLPTVRRRCREIGLSFRESLWRILRLQAPVTLLAIAGLPPILHLLGMDGLDYFVFRLSCLGSLLQVLILAHFLAALHLAFYRLALGAAAVFLAGGTGMALLTMEWGIEYAGLGNVLSGLGVLALLHPLLGMKLRRLDRDTFMSQPLS